MRKIILFLFCLLVLKISLLSQENFILLKFISFDAYPAFDCEVYVNGIQKGYTRDNGTYDFYYDSNEKSYTLEVKSLSEKVSKKFNIEIKNGKPDLKSEFIGFNQLGAYLNLEEYENKINQMMINFKNAGVTDLFIPVFYDGKVIFPSKVKLIKSSKKDYLKEIIEIGKKFNIRIHAVINTLNWGKDKNNLKQYNDLLMTNRSGQWNAGSEKEYLYVSPSHPLVIQTLIDIVREIAINYNDLYGISFDYLRFKKGSASNYTTDDFGYEENSIVMFKNTFKIDPLQIKPDTTRDSDWLKWIEHKENLITNLLVKMISAIKDTNSTIKITISADPNYYYNRGNDLSCENFYDIGEFTRIDYVLMQVSLQNLENDLQALEPFITKTLPMIYSKEKVTENKFNDLIDYLKKNRYDYFFGLYDTYLFESKNNQERLIDITFRR